MTESANTALHSLLIRQYNPAADAARLLHYLQALSSETKSRFGPHPFEANAIDAFYQNTQHRAFVAEDTAAGALVAYAIVKTGYLEHDKARLQSQGIEPHPAADCTFAPSVADAWQGKGLGSRMLHAILKVLQPEGVQRIILWGGVQAGNENAVRYYLNNQFRITGSFEHNGPNYDMVRLVG